jgi:hypothetical protein
LNQNSKISGEELLEFLKQQNKKHMESYKKLQDLPSIARKKKKAQH